MNTYIHTHIYHICMMCMYVCMHVLWFDGRHWEASIGILTLVLVVVVETVGVAVIIVALVVKVSVGLVVVEVIAVVVGKGNHTSLWWCKEHLDHIHL